MAELMWLEDFEPGQIWTSPPVQMTEIDIIEFGRRYDPQPFHTDPAAAKQTIFGGLVASGWHTMANVMRLLVEHGPKPAAGMVGLGVDELRFPRPVKPDDEFHLVVEMLEATRSPRRPERGTIKLGLTAVNQDGEDVLRAWTTVLVPARPDGDN